MKEMIQPLQLLAIFLLMLAMGCGKSQMVTIRYDEQATLKKQNLLDILKLIESGETEQTDYRLQIQMPHKNTEYRTLSIIPQENNYQLMILDAETDEMLNSYTLKRSYIRKDTIPPAIVKKIVPKP